MASLMGKKIIVVGGSSGIGLGVAKRLSNAARTSSSSAARRTSC